MRSLELGDLKLIVLDADGPALASERDALDILGDVYGHDADIIVVPVTRLPPEFFDLATKTAGLIMEKFTNYGQRVAFVGDISGPVAESRALADFVRETNKRKQIIFARDETELESILLR